MHTSKLYVILQQLDKIEQNRFRKYIHSPYFNRDQTLIDLFELLAGQITGERDHSLEKEDIWDDINGEKEYDDVRFRKYCSDLLKLVEGYLAQEAYESNPIHHSKFLMEAVGKKRIKKLYSGALRSARRASKKQPHEAAEHFYHQYHIERIYYEMEEHELNRSSRSNLEEIAQNLDLFYLGEKLRLYCAVLSRQNIKSYEYKLLFIDEIIAHLQEYDYENIPHISIYYHVYLIYTDSENVDHYYKLKKLLNKYGLIFPQDEALTLYYSAVNYSIQKINMGENKFLEELFDLYNDLINKEIIFIDEHLSPWDFKNIVHIALRLGKYDWTRHFIQNYQDRIHEKYRENAVSYNLARLYWYQKKHEKVIELLREVEYEDFSYNLGSKTMLLATYYETDEIEPLYSLLESFRVFLNRHKDLPDERRKYYKNLIRFTKKLSKILPGDADRINKLKKEIHETQDFKDQWLEEKIAELQ